LGAQQQVAACHAHPSISKGGLWVGKGKHIICIINIRHIKAHSFARFTQLAWPLIAQTLATPTKIRKPQRTLKNPLPHSQPFSY